MSSLFFTCFSSTAFSSPISFFTNHHLLPVARILPLRGKEKGEHFDLRPLCNAKSEHHSQVVFQNGLPRIKWKEIVDGDIQVEEENVEKINEYVNDIKSMLGSMEDGNISISAYDTAWVALLPNDRHSGTPQFPSTLEWIANNQLVDGSWGDTLIFLAYDRLINTLACVVALKTWNIHPDKCQKGLAFFNENIRKLENENAEHITCGFELVLPSLLDKARSLDIQIPYDSPIFQDIYTKRSLKLKRIPNDILHNVPTTLLHSLEGMAGMAGLEWEKLLKLQCEDGSFLFSPSATAFAFMQTNDENCLRYLKKTVEKFNGGVPFAYPLDLFERLWCVDRLQRLGISRYFKPETKQYLDYVNRYWTDEGIGWARNIQIMDIDDTAMGFRLLRLHGYAVSAEVFRHFEKDGEYFCFAGHEINRSVSVNFNLYRCSQVLFPGEKILEDIKLFSSSFLRERQDANQFFDKWVITKDLPGEVGLALKIPWYASLPRVETRFYIEQYGGEDVVWLAKSLYRLGNVNNNAYLELAKLDYKICQAVLQMEWDSMQKWYSEMNLGEFEASHTSLLLNYFLAAACIFEPERSQERLAWAKTAVLVEIISSFFDNHIEHADHQKVFVQVFGSDTDTHARLDMKVEKLMDTLLRTLNHISLDVADGRDIRGSLCRAWEKWMMMWAEGGDRQQRVAELLVQTINLSSDNWALEDIWYHPQYQQLCTLTNRVCHQLSKFHSLNRKVHDDGCYNSKSQKIEEDMQQLVELVLSNSLDHINSDMKQTFLTVARSFYYAACCDLETITFHIAKVLFEKVQ